MALPDITLQRGLPKEHRSSAALLYDEAFGQKFSVAVKSDEKRLALLEACFVADHAMVALASQKLVGIAGFQTPQGTLTGNLTYRALLSKLGFWAGNWAALIFSLYERKPLPGELLMDGIAVHKDFRGKGIGGRLLDAVAHYARDQQYQHIRLDVIDLNPRARKLYETKGFHAVKTEHFAYLHWLLGFGSSTTMRLNLNTLQRPVIKSR